MHANGSFSCIVVSLVSLQIQCAFRCAQLNIVLIFYLICSSQRIVATSPIFKYYLQYNNLYLCAVTCRNSNVALIATFLFKLASVFKDYFGTLEEESIRDNFVIIYELLDEMMDMGYPQTTDFKILSEFIKSNSYALEKIGKFIKQMKPKLVRP